jgi:hypothetical protein
MNLKKVIAITKKEDSITEYTGELENTHQQVYDILDLSFKVNKDSSASNIFYSTLFKKCKDKGVFDNLIERIHYIIDNTDYDIIKMVDLLERVVYFAFFDNQLLDVLYETVEKLDQKVQKLILYRLKISAEKRYENKQVDLTREYEEFRFRLRSDYKRVAVQGYCGKCKSMQNLALHYNELTSRRVKCPICKTNQILLD